jgi:hypothetical protein
LVTPWEIALSKSEKTKVLTGSLEIQFELAHDPLEQAVIETVIGGCGHILPPVSELKFANAVEVKKTIWNLKFGKAPEPSGIPNRHDWNTEKILSTRILSEVSGRGVLRKKQFGLRPKRSNASSLKECPGTLTRRS